MKLISQKLSSVFSLSNYEAKIYIAACTFNRANISQIARASGIPRTAVYPSIKNLLDKGFLLQIISGKRKYYKALSPKELKSIFERKKIDLSFLVNELSSNIPAASENLEVQYFPGKNGVARASDLFLENTKSKLWRTFENAVFNQTSIEFHQFEKYITRRVKKGIKGRVILAMDMMYPWIKERIDKNGEELRDVLIVPEKLFSFRVVLATNEDSILVLSGEDVVFGAIIKNVQLAQTVSTIHDIIWSHYKEGSKFL